jgi:hypothetical protein
MDLNFLIDLIKFMPFKIEYIKTKTKINSLDSNVLANGNKNERKIVIPVLIVVVNLNNKMPPGY